MPVGMTASATPCSGYDRPQALSAQFSDVLCRLLACFSVPHLSFRARLLTKLPSDFLPSCPQIYNGSLVTPPADSGHGGGAGTLQAFDQTQFFGSGPFAGFSDSGHIYVPKQCEARGKPCRLHLYFHGCGAKWCGRFASLDAAPVCRLTLTRERVLCVSPPGFIRSRWSI